MLSILAAFVLAGCGLTQGATTKPPTGPGQLTANPSTISFGNVNSSTSAQQNVLLTNTESVNVTISQVNPSDPSITISGFTMPMTLTAGQSTIMTVSYTPKSAVTMNAFVTVVSDATNPQLTVSVTGTGVQGHSVALSWNASTTAGVTYNVYRWTGSQTGQLIILQTFLTTTSITDSTVVSGQTYIYATTAVDSSGVESSFSNTVSVIIP